MLDYSNYLANVRRGYRTEEDLKKSQTSSSSKAMHVIFAAIAGLSAGMLLSQMVSQDKTLVSPTVECVTSSSISPHP